MRMACGEDRFNCNLYVARGTVLEANRAGEARGELAVDLTLGCSRADSSPAYEVGDILGRDHVEEFSAGGHAHLSQIEKEAACNTQSITDTERFIEVRVVDQTFPAKRSPRFLKIHTHDNQKITGKVGDSLLQK